MMDVPSYWLGPGHAPGFSRSVARASQAVRDAEAALYEALKKGYPRGSDVYVIHHRGSFAGTVEGWDTYGTRVIVKNTRSGKVSKWWAAHVQLTDPTADSAAGVTEVLPFDREYVSSYLTEVLAEATGNADPEVQKLLAWLAAGVLGKENGNG